VGASVCGAVPVNPWRSSGTSVNPGSSIDFVSAEVGWRVTGQVFGPHIDGDLAAFVGGEVDWPGTSVSATSDGGRTWSTVLEVSTGIWGLDFVGPRVGYAVAVTSLRRTSDGGSHWQEVGEPPGHALVWVDFQSASDGFGLTGPGTLVRTTDGGSSWSGAGLGTAGAAACFVSPDVGYVADRAGDLYRTSDGARSWRVAESAPKPPVQYVGPWADLACSGGDVALGLEAFCAAACGAFPNLYLLDYSDDGGRTWAARSGGWLRDGDAAFGSSGPHLPYGALGAVALNPAGAAVFSDVPGPSGNSADDVQVGTVAASGGGTTLEMGSAPALPASPVGYALATCHVLGIGFVGRTGWLYFDDGAVGTAGHRLGEPVVWQTTDTGAVWSVLSTGPTEAPPPA
jgi:photosystem II stability/assembly factor-like uncharacterized protein